MKITKKSAAKWKENFLSFYYSTNPEQQKKAIILLERHKPQYLYQYRRGMYDKTNNRNYDLENLRNSIMRLSSPVLFNDPYDCSFMINPKILYSDYIKETLRPISESEFLADLESCEELLRDIDNFRHRFHIGCLSEKNNSLLMWSHYANNHSGFCIKYSYKSLLQLNLYPLPILYTKQISDIATFVLNNNFEGTKKALFEKSIEWKYENEWRIVITSSEIKDYQEIAIPIPHAIYLGCSSSVKLAKDLTSICREKNIPLYQMQMLRDRFELTSILR